MTTTEDRRRAAFGAAALAMEHLLFDSFDPDRASEALKLALKHLEFKEGGTVASEQKRNQQRTGKAQ